MCACFVMSFHLSGIPWHPMTFNRSVLSCDVWRCCRIPTRIGWKFLVRSSSFFSPQVGLSIRLRLWNVYRMCTLHLYLYLMVKVKAVVSTSWSCRAYRYNHWFGERERERPKRSMTKATELEHFFPQLKHLSGRVTNEKVYTWDILLFSILWLFYVFSSVLMQIVLFTNMHCLCTWWLCWHLFICGIIGRRTGWVPTQLPRMCLQLFYHYKIVYLPRRDDWLCDVWRGWPWASFAESHISIESFRRDVTMFYCVVLSRGGCISRAVGGHKRQRNEGKRSNSNLISCIIWYKKEHASFLQQFWSGWFHPS